MAVKIQVPKKAALVRFVLHPWGRAFLIAFLAVNTIALVTFTFYYVKYSRLIEEKLLAGPFANTSMLFAAPQVVMIGDQLTVQDVVAQLRKSGYGEARSSRMGWYNVRPDAIEIFPGPDSYFDQEEGVLKLQGGKVKQIISLRDNTERTQYLLEPELITNLFDKNREKRRIVRFQDIPPLLIKAVTSAEDKRFFQHSGFDPLRILKAAYVDIREGRREQGASTLSQQLARNFWLTPAKTWKRKLAELMITLHLEQKLSKEQIFEYYANQVDLGRRGSFAIRGFGEAAQTYFNKDLRDLNLAEAATLGGLIQRPSYTNPVRWPERAKTRRNIVLMMMRENGYITDREYAVAREAPMVVSHGGAESTDAPYFVDLVNEHLQDQFQDRDFQTNTYRVYTSLDLNLQRDASEAIRIGMKEVDEQIRKRTKKGQTPREPQAALIVLDPQTGEVKALIGGRDYGASQLNRALAKRQPGSSFKPFVYAAALNTALSGASVTFTPATTIVDEPTTFYYDNRPYQPSNHHNEFHGTVTLRQAISKSMNIPAVKLAESVGYRTVVDLARRAGLNMEIRATPALALGAYEVTPLEIAGAYTMYANRGVVSKPNWIKQIRSQKGGSIFDANPDRKAVLDPRVSFLMVDLLQEVVRSGTGAGVRSRGVTIPVAGKTGTSRDGWFAGFSSKLVCVVWVGYDDGSELNLEGARSALPIWAEFMKRAHSHREYRNVHGWEAPDGIVSVDIDPASGGLATPMCPSARSEYFISGSQPVELCRLHSNGTTQVAGWETAPAKPQQPGTPVPGPVSPNAEMRTAQSQPPAAATPPAEQPADPPSQKKPGFFGRLKGIFK
ncbi:MAG TPA: PBP1A family penicillin-binding protein [Bryobacteraceae bacterium]|nr:PBP1A family penicillin-binding protein [Bryobacteraceae bacterium]